MKRHSFKQINVVPFIDVMLVLLAIVLTTASFINFQKFNVQLPDTQHQTPISTLPEYLQIGLSKTGEVLIDDVKVSNQILLERLSKVSVSQQVMLQIDRNAPFSSFTRLIDVLKKYSLDKRTYILTQQI